MLAEIELNMLRKGQYPQEPGYPISPAVFFYRPAA